MITCCNGFKPHIVRLCVNVHVLTKCILCVQVFLLCFVCFSCLFVLFVLVVCFSCNSLHQISHLRFCMYFSSECTAVHYG